MDIPPKVEVPRPISSRMSRLFLVAMSLWFYGYYNLSYLWIMVCSLAMNYLISAGMERFGEKSFGKSGKLTAGKLLLGIGLFCNLGLLFYFKYFGFFTDIFAGLFGYENPITKPVLPIGISFYTFQTMSYTIDVYRGDARVQKNIVTFGSFVTLFPQLIAGPILQYKDLDNQLRSRDHTANRFADGIQIFVIGLAKKAGRLEVGEEPTGAAARARDARLLLLASDADIYSGTEHYEGKTVLKKKRGYFELPMTPYSAKFFKMK